VDNVLEASAIQKLPVPLQPVEEANGKKIPLCQRKLMCDDECSKMERKRALADAFGITSPNLEGLYLGDSSEALSDLLRRDPKWVLSVEERCKLLVMGKGRSGSNSVKVHVFCIMLKEKRDAVRLIADRWKLSVKGAGWEPKRFIVVHVTPKSKPPARIIGTNSLQPPGFDPLVDMDPRRVVGLFDLPGDADVSALVLRFGGECELVWLNDKNALAVFSDPARAATAMRRLDHGCVYYGVIVLLPTAIASAGPVHAWGGGDVGGAATLAAPLKGHSSWKKAVVHEISNPSLGNRWNALDSETSAGSSAVPTPVNKENSDVVDDWENTSV
jgi:transcriptional repressor NF-X1